MGQYIQVDKVINAARDLYDAAPDPQTMGIILGAVYDRLEQVSQIRGEVVSTDPSVWEENLLHMFEGADAVRRAAEDRARQVQQWDEQAQKFWLRFEAYQNRLIATIEGDVASAGSYAGNVQMPVLQGNAWATPERQAWSKVGNMPDVATPFTLMNQLATFVEATDLEQSIRGWAEQVVTMFYKNALDRARGIAAEIGEEAANELERRAQKYVDEARDQIEEQRAEAREEVEGSVMIVAVVALVAAGLGAWIFTRKGRG